MVSLSAIWGPFSQPTTLFGGLLSEAPPKKPPPQRGYRRTWADEFGRIQAIYRDFSGIFNRQRTIANGEMVPRRGLEKLNQTIQIK